MCMNKTIENYSKNYWLIMLIFFGIFTAGQCLTVYYWDKGLKLIDVFELILAPACCFSIASLAGLYKNKIMLVVSSIYVWGLANLFYAIFQKVSFFKESDIFSLIITNVRIFGIPLAVQCFIASLVCFLVIKKKNRK